MIAKYEVTYWDDLNQKESSEKGFVTGESDGDMIYCLKEYYGREGVSSFKIEYIETTEEGIVTEEDIKKLFE